ncbi:MAG: type I methionyl aminopeptidase [Patescibacteria group bacterium]|jgi:methionyl aminopeptidase|nr:type I methionyl aminopeptidase [Patescibacteria group bacterium]MDD5172932.1 type I methionyl aminopeptidase [Patescibacteria group bacterium]
MILIKTSKEIEIMRQAGKILSEVMKKIVPHVHRGVSTLELDKLAEKLIRENGAEPGFKNYESYGRFYPATLCTSINNQVVHALPKKNKILKNGDIIGLDCGVKYKGYYSDMALTVGVGEISFQAKRLIQITKESLEIAIKNIRPEIHLGDISWPIQSFVEKNRLSVVRQLCGHGIGKELHEEPNVFNYGDRGTGLILKPGMVLAIEPMVNEGDWRIETLDDEWTIVTKDGSLSAHFEHTILITKTGAEVLTKIN